MTIIKQHNLFAKKKEKKTYYRSLHQNDERMILKYKWHITHFLYILRQRRNFFYSFDSKNIFHYLPSTKKFSDSIYSNY